MMKPILFSTPMVQAILDGRKTQTRRVINPQPNDSGMIAVVTNRGEPDEINVHDKGLAPYRPSDILWVRETWAMVYGFYMHKADKPDDHPYVEKWKPSIFMPLEAARLFLRVTGVRVERVQEISDDDVHAEGISYIHDDMGERNAFSVLWDNLNAKRGYGWDTNPWVWVYTFERCEAPERKEQDNGS